MSDAAGTHSSAQIVHFVVDDATEETAVSLCHAMNESDGGSAFAQTVLRLGESSVTRSPSKGVEFHQLRSAKTLSGSLDWCSFDLAEQLRKSRLLHIHSPFTLAGEAAFALGKNLGLLCVIDCSSPIQSNTGWKWGMAQIVDAMTCTSRQRMEELRRDSSRPIELLPQADLVSSAKILFGLYRHLIL